MRELLNAKRQPQVAPARPAPPIPGQTSGQNSFLPYPTSAAAGYPTLPGPAYPPVSQPGYPTLPGYPARPAYGVPAYPPHSNPSYRLPTPPFR
ncbi:vacuolar protein sorting-associated protein 37C isoform X2 [Eurytemora carolleeae]|uniref:vacuolar protein sorting-associated protein 37C isoform X1 n=1 Tax=Eurytemora carolleeae TaxID=1294199 RepID=UPI000C76F89F|nr:vacuolar protein sorting-associated protein 37C isoform X1 [Eurytemora carolleeae]XP_023347694.1 vacuolar protein sorting-associated protein 37C isoform X2 [Eurytemora carolleeae]|eukprot:XP_023347693.1 vacuolar protein sorting-associated protein 37C-like isoform X1 [Eurytemora affinis]